MDDTLVEISCQKAWTRELRQASACSLSSGAGSCSIASSEPAELTVTAAAAMSAGADPPPRCPLGCAAARFLLVRRRLDFACALLRALLGAEEDGGFAGEERRGGPAANIWDPGGAIPKPAGGRRPVAE